MVIPSRYPIVTELSFQIDTKKVFLDHLHQIANWGDER